MQHSKNPRRPEEGYKRKSLPTPEWWTWPRPYRMMDCLKGLKKYVPKKSIDLVITDPPYNIDYSSNYGSERYKKRIQEFSWDKDFDFKKYWSIIWNRMKWNSDAYVFGRWENYNMMKSLKGFKQILIWDKMSGGLGYLRAFIPSYELIFYFKKGRRKPNKRTPAVIRESTQSSFKYGNPKKTYLHPTQKPIGLIVKLVLISSHKGNVVLDPFLGSGTTILACRQTGRIGIGFEINSRYKKAIRQRVMADTPSLERYG